MLGINQAFNLKLCVNTQKFKVDTTSKQNFSEVLVI